MEFFTSRLVWNLYEEQWIILYLMVKLFNQSAHKDIVCIKKKHEYTV